MASNLLNSSSNCLICVLGEKSALESEASSSQQLSVISFISLLQDEMNIGIGHQRSS